MRRQSHSAMGQSCSTPIPNTKPSNSNSTSQPDTLIPTDFFIDLGKNIDVILSMPDVCPFTGKPLRAPAVSESTDKPSRKSAKQSRRTHARSKSRSTSCGATPGFEMKTYLHADPMDLESGLMDAFHVGEYCPEPVEAEELAHRWSLLHPDSSRTGHTRWGASRRSEEGKEDVDPVFSRQPSNERESPTKVADWVMLRSTERRRHYASADVDAPPCLSPTHGQTEPSQVEKQPAHVEKKRATTPKVKKFTPPNSSRVAVKMLEAEASVSPSEAPCVEEAVDRLREHFIQRFGSARKAFAALRKAGADLNSPAVRSADIMTTKELRNAMRTLGVQWPQISGYGNIHKILKTFDVNNSGNMCFEEVMGVQNEDSSSSDGDKENDDEDNEPLVEVTWQQKREIEQAQQAAARLAERQGRPRWNNQWKHTGMLATANNTNNIIGRDLLLRSHRLVHHTLSEEGELPIWIRAQQVAKEKARALREESDKRREKELDGCTFQPKTFTTCRDTDDEAVQSGRLRSEKRLAEYRESSKFNYSFQPRICERSLRIYRVMRAADESWLDRLGQMDAHQRMCLKKPTTNTELTFSPKVSERSQKLQRCGSVYNRLFHANSDKQLVEPQCASPGSKRVLEYTPKLGRLLHFWERATENTEATIFNEWLPLNEERKKSPRGSVGGDSTDTGPGSLGHGWSWRGSNHGQSPASWYGFSMPGRMSTRSSPAAPIFRESLPPNDESKLSSRGSLGGDMADTARSMGNRWSRKASYLGQSPAS